MKIIAGKFKGKNLAYRERRSLRVTSQMVKEAMFGMIGNLVEGAKVLDLYCGYGSLGLEAISRGAKFVTFVDVDGQALKQLKFFLEKLEISNQAELIKKDAIKTIKRIQPESYDIIIMDPPYHSHFEKKTLEAIEKEKILKPGGMCVVEHYSDYEMPDSYKSMVKKKTKVYGDTAISIYVTAGKEVKVKEPVISEETILEESKETSPKEFLETTGE